MLYSFARFLCKIVLKIFFNVKVSGTSDFPDHGPVIVYSNHKSMWDPVIIGCTLKRPVFFMAKQELFDIPLIGFFLRSINAFPVKRNTADRKAIRKAIKLLSEGKVLGIFPEGTRSKSGDLLEPEPGLALIALKNRQTKLVPVAIKGNYKFFTDIEVIFGKPKMLDIKAERYTSQILKDISAQLFEEVHILMTS
ncbi:MAG TPA: 1-acyl-sn-glycerol-3-phosphate acyltransferase [Thermoanaerobacterales bacterium]|mgnify:CR=1 FL=1|nr:1-acyl-sn-glycerol-3-phosphate acyltransferase [Thermoanaerobacterales bacterium]